MTKEQMLKRTKQLALRVVCLCDALPAGRAAHVIGGQLLRSGTSVAANYRAACRDRAAQPPNRLSRGSAREAQSPEDSNPRPPLAHKTAGSQPANPKSEIRNPKSHPPEERARG